MNGVSGATCTPTHQLIDRSTKEFLGGLVEVDWFAAAAAAASGSNSNSNSSSSSSSKSGDGD